MAKTTKKTGQAAAAASSQPPPPNVAEDEPHLEFDEEEMDDATLKSCRKNSLQDLYLFSCNLHIIKQTCNS